MFNQKKTIPGRDKYLTPECSGFSMECGQLLCNSAGLTDMLEEDLINENFDA